MWSSTLDIEQFAGFLIFGQIDIGLTGAQISGRDDYVREWFRQLFNRDLKIILGSATVPATPPRLYLMFFDNAVGARFSNTNPERYVRNVDRSVFRKSYASVEPITRGRSSAWKSFSSSPEFQCTDDRMGLGPTG